MRILKVEPGKAPYAKEMEEGLKAIQREVEGLFQPLSIVQHKDSLFPGM